ncbi:MAG: hypothetical protein ACTHN3_08020 [Solirubrobacterales bacterium]
MLPDLADVVLEQLVPMLDEVEGRWHPTGFMVFPLGAHPELGTLRFHVWPAGFRRREPKGRGWLGEIFDGDIHDHAWSVASHVLLAYEDAFFDVEPAESEEGPLSPDLFRLFTVAYGDNAHNALTTDGSCVVATPTERRSYRHDEFHTVDVGQFHAPTIPDERLGATLVFSSPRRQEEGPYVLIGGETKPIVGNRRAVTKQEAREARAQIQAAA